jgi:hypothetical protein
LATKAASTPVLPNQKKQCCKIAQFVDAPCIKWGLVWYMDRSKTSKGSGSGVYRWDSRRECSFNLGLQTTIIQAKIYASKACIIENLEKGYTGRNICILSDSQAAIEALDSF